MNQSNTSSDKILGTIKSLYEKIITSKDDETKYKILKSVDKAIIQKSSENLTRLIDLIFGSFANSIWISEAILLLCPFCTDVKLKSFETRDENEIGQQYRHQKFGKILDVLNNHCDNTNNSISNETGTNIDSVINFVKHYILHYAYFDVCDIINIANKFPKNFSDVINLFRTKFRSNICINNEFIKEIKKLSNDAKYQLLYFASNNFVKYDKNINDTETKYERLHSISRNFIRNDNDSSAKQTRTKCDFDHDNPVLKSFDKKYLLPLLNTFDKDSRKRTLTFCSVRTFAGYIDTQEFIELMDMHDKTWNHIMVKHEFQTCCRNDDLNIDMVISMMKLCSNDERHKIIDHCRHFLPLFTKIDDLLKLLSLDNCDQRISLNHDQKMYIVDSINHIEYFKLRVTARDIENLIKTIDHTQTCEKICTLIGTNKYLMYKYFEKS